MALILFLLSGCTWSLLPERVSEQASTSESAAVSVSATGDAHACLRVNPPSWPWRFAADGDFIPAIEEAVGGRSVPSIISVCPIFLADFDADGREDVATLEVFPEARRSRLRLVFCGGEEVLLHEWPALPSETGGIIPSFVWLKPAGEPVLREYLDEEMRTALLAKAALEFCSPMATDPLGLPKPMDRDNVCFCSTFLSFEGRQVRTGMVCD